MPAPTLTHLRKTAPIHGLKAIPGEGPGVFEGVVAVFNNVDLQGDRIVPGAFASSLDAWQKSGDPIPVIFSHQWDSLEAHLGVVVDAKELLPGDPLLTPQIRANGGLWVKMALDVEDPNSWAGRVAKLMGRRSLREFSFAYDITDSQPVDDGKVLELRGLDVIEVGPTLKGANPLTALLSRKAVADLRTEVLGEIRGALRDVVREEIAAALGGQAANLDGGAPGNPEDPNRPNPDKGEEAGDGNGEDRTDAGEAERLALELDLLELEAVEPSSP